MTLSRRTIMKSIAFSPFFSILNTPLPNEFFAQGSPSSTYFLLHGMFFMEFQGDNLCVVTPKPPSTPTGNDHEFYQRTHGGMLANLGTDIDFTMRQVKAGGLKQFPPDIPQFSASGALGKPQPILPNKGTGTYRCRIILPTPKHIFAYRSDTKDYFRPQGNVGKSILDSTGPRLGTITCLQYEPDQTAAFVMNYYAEHPGPASTGDVNAALRTAKDICGASFDLQMNPGWVFDSNVDPENSLPAGVSQDDESTLEEVIGLFALYRHLLSEDAKKSLDSLKLNHQHPFAADIASCPQFGINP